MECRAAFVYDKSMSDDYKIRRLIARYDVGYYKKTMKRKFPLVIPKKLQKQVDVRIRQRQALLANRWSSHLQLGLSNTTTVYRKAIFLFYIRNRIYNHVEMSSVLTRQSVFVVYMDRPSTLTQINKNVRLYKPQ